MGTLDKNDLEDAIRMKHNVFLRCVSMELLPGRNNYCFLPVITEPGDLGKMELFTSYVWTRTGLRINPYFFEEDLSLEQFYTSVEGCKEKDSWDFLTFSTVIIDDPEEEEEDTEVVDVVNTSYGTFALRGFVDTGNGLMQGYIAVDAIEELLQLEPVIPMTVPAHREFRSKVIDEIADSCDRLAEKIKAKYGKDVKVVARSMEQAADEEEMTGYHQGMKNPLGRYLRPLNAEGTRFEKILDFKNPVIESIAAELEEYYDFPITLEVLSESPKLPLSDMQHTVFLSTVMMEGAERLLGLWDHSGIFRAMTLGSDGEIMRFFLVDDELKGILGLQKVVEGELTMEYAVISTTPNYKNTPE